MICNYGYQVINKATEAKEEDSITLYPAKMSWIITCDATNLNPLPKYANSGEEHRPKPH